MRNSPQRGQIWQVTFEPKMGAEIAKTRPAIVINVPEAGRLPLRIVVPLTDWNPSFAGFFWFVYVPPSRENGLSKESGADCFQVKSLSIARFICKLGQATDVQLENIACAIALCVGYKNE